MDISNREKKLLCIVVSVALGVLYYKTAFATNSANLESKRLERDTIQDKYDQDVAKIKTIEDRKIQLSDLKEVGFKSAKDYYPEIIQEKLIREVEELMTKNNLTGDYSWGTRKAEAVENLTPGIISLPSSSLQVFADSIKSDLGKSLENLGKKLNESVENSNQAEANTSTATPSTNVSTDGSTSSSDVYPVQMKLTINFKGTYDSLRNFVQDIKDYGRVVTSSALSTTWESESTISSGTIDIEFYSIPKINDEDNSYLDWN